MLNFIKAIAMVVFAITLYSCSDDSNPIKENPTTELNYLYTFDYNGYTYNIYSESNSIEEGFNVLYLSANDSEGNDISQNLNVNITMTMADMIHSTPFDFELVELDGKNYIKINATFIMPSIEMGKWAINVVEEELAIDEQLEINVEPSGLVKRFISDDTTYFVTLRSLRNLKVGMNDFIISVHTRETMMKHPPAEDLTIRIEPTMPSMGHGSDGNINPIYSGNGVYKGEVNFSMTGNWEIALTLSQGNKDLKTIVYEVNL